jgi:hypothetical protein
MPWNESAGRNRAARSAVMPRMPQRAGHYVSTVHACSHRPARPCATPTPAWKTSFWPTNQTITVSTGLARIEAGSAWSGSTNTALRPRRRHGQPTACARSGTLSLSPATLTVSSLAGTTAGWLSPPRPNCCSLATAGWRGPSNAAGPVDRRGPTQPVASSAQLGQGTKLHSLTDRPPSR